MTPLLYLLLFLSPPIPYRQLSWSDFRGTPPIAIEASACTCTNIVIGMDTAYAIFDPTRSWTKTTDADVLRHEQFHFNITYYWANFIAREMKLKPPYSAHSIDQVLRLWRKMQRQYDRETDHGRNEVEQKRWEQLIKL